jgi:hypothetical protein
MNLLISIVVLALQRVPFVNQIPAIRDAGTIERAISGLNKAVAKLEDVAANQSAAAADKAAAIKVLEAEHSAALEVAARAKRVAGKVADLVA